MSKRNWLIIAGLVVTAVLGILAGNWWINKHASSDKFISMDEYVGLGQRTGLTGDVELLVQPISLTVESGQPVNVNLTLINRTKKTLIMNGWLDSTPSEFKNNQFPIKVICSRNGRGVPYRGNVMLLPPHKKKDFFKLRPGEQKIITADLSRGPGDGRWDIASPGMYTFEVWYETYLTGRYIGVNAWTGMTNHAIVQVTVVPKGT